MCYADNNIGAEGAARMAAALQRNTTLTTLNISCVLQGEGKGGLALLLREQEWVVVTSCTWNRRWWRRTCRRGRSGGG